MGYLNYLPKFKYTLAKLTENVSDIFRRVAFTQKSRGNPQNYALYLTEGDKTPDNMASSELNNANYYWQILMMNNIISKNEFPANYREYSKKVNTLKNGTSLFFYEFFGGTPKVGDLVFSAATGGNTLDFASGGIISNYDSILRKIDMEYIFGDGFGDMGTTAAVYGHDNTGQLVRRDIKQFILKSNIDNSVSYFYDTNNRETSPYFSPTGFTGGSFSNPLAVTPGVGSLLQTYMIGGNLPSGYYYRSELQDYSDDQLAKRNLKIPPAQLVDQVDQNAEKLLRDGIRGDEILNGADAIIIGVGANTTSTTQQSD
jgi:hypothetical protein